MGGFEIAWWVWCLAGIVLLLAEFLTPGAFYQLFFGLAAIVVGLLAAIGAGLSLPVQLGLFLILSIGSLALLRKPLQLRFEETTDHKVDSIEGETAVALDDIAAGATGKAELRGTIWNARNVGEEPIESSHRCVVEKVDGLTLWIRA